MQGTTNGTNGTTALPAPNGMNGSANATSTNGTSTNGNSLPSASSPSLILTQPTPSERRLTWHKSSVDWGKALPLSTYIEREELLCTASPLTRSGGVSHWILVDKTLPPDQRPILATSESLRKRTLLKVPGEDRVREVLSHGIGSVFCYPEYRGHGYASRMMRELGEKLKTWQGTDEVPVAFTALYSDIGKGFYAAHGWAPFPSSHIEFPPSSSDQITKSSRDVKILKTADLVDLSAQDEAMLRSSLARSTDAKTHVAIPPDSAHFEWHRAREEFLTSHLFGKVPEIRGALVGEVGRRVWAVWTRSYYEPLGEVKSKNTLHILRLVVEEEALGVAEGGEGELVEKLRDVVEVARREAREWRCRHVEVWNPSPLVRGVVARMGVDYRDVQRETESIPSVMWYGKGGEEVEWVGNEKYGWC